MNWLAQQDVRNFNKNSKKIPLLFVRFFYWILFGLKTRPRWSRRRGRWREKCLTKEKIKLPKHFPTRKKEKQNIYLHRYLYKERTAAKYIVKRHKVFILFSYLNSFVYSPPCSCSCFQSLLAKAKAVGTKLFPLNNWIHRIFYCKSASYFDVVTGKWVRKSWTF